MAALMEQLELPLWTDLKAVEAAPETADLVALLDRLEASMESLPLQEKLQVAWEGFLELVGLLEAKAGVLIEEWEDAHNDLGPKFDEDLLLSLTQKTMYLDVSGLCRQKGRAGRRQREKEDGGTQVVELTVEEAIAWSQPEASVDAVGLEGLEHDEGARQMEGAIALLLKDWGGEAGLCEVAEAVAGGKAIAVLLVTLLSSGLSLVFDSESFYLSLDCLRIRLE